MANEQDGLTDFDVTIDDLQRLERWLGEQNRGATLEEITRRIIRGRLLFGRDKSKSALSGWIQEKHVLSWDEIDKWCLECQVLVARRQKDKTIIPLFGVIVTMDEKYFGVQIDNEVITFKRVEPNSKEANDYYNSIKTSIWQQEQQQNRQSIESDLNDKVNTEILKSGALTASRIQGALEKDNRFIPWNLRWYLRTWIQKLSITTLQQAHLQILRTTKTARLTEILKYIPDLPQGELGELSLFQALSKAPDLFRQVEDGWQAIPPPPPPWQKAVGAYYVYDPETYQILLQPDEPLKKKTAERLEALGLYAEVVKLKDEETAS